MRALAPSAEYAAVRADEANFIDPASMGVVLTDEVVIVDGVINVVLDDAPPNLPPGVTTRVAGEAAR